MSWFSKNQSSNANQKQQIASEPFIVDDQVMKRVAELMNMFNDAVGNDAMVFATAKSISSAAGLHDIKQMVGVKFPVEVLMYRPWEMLAAVTVRAAQNGDNILAARIFGFTSFWDLVVAPQLTPADYFDLLLIGCPPAIEVEIASIAFISLLLLSAERVIFSNATESVTVGELTWNAANVLVKAPEKGIPVDDVVLATVKSYFG